MEQEKNNKVIKIVLVIVFSLFVGALGMYSLFYYFPVEVGSVVNVNKTEKEVTVTDVGIADSVEKIMDAVVIVNTYNKESSVASGTGFVYKVEDGKAYILTNHHVIESGSSVKVVFTDGSVHEVDIVGSDQYADIAVLSMNEKDVLSVATMGKSNDSRVGDTVFTVGAPLDSVYSWTVTRGIVSGKDRMVEVALSNSSSSDWIMKVLQTDAAINSGNSGGPLANSNGEVIGINSMKLVSSGVEGMGFAIPIEDAVEYAEQIIVSGEINRPFLGVSMFDLTDIHAQYQTGIKVDSSITSGVVIAEVESKSPAASSGLKAGDVITHINGEKITSVASLRYELFKHSEGDKIEVKYIRDTSEKTTSVTLKSAS